MWTPLDVLIAGSIAVRFQQAWSFPGRGSAIRDAGRCLLRGTWLNNLCCVCRLKIRRLSRERNASKWWSQSERDSIIFQYHQRVDDVVARRRMSDLLCGFPCIHFLGCMFRNLRVPVTVARCGKVDTCGWGAGKGGGMGQEGERGLQRLFSSHNRKKYCQQNWLLEVIALFQLPFQVGISMF